MFNAHGVPVSRHPLDSSSSATTTTAEVQSGHLRQRSLTAAQQIQNSYRAASVGPPQRSGWVEPSDTPVSLVIDPFDPYSPSGRSFASDGKAQGGSSSKAKYGTLPDEQEFRDFARNLYTPERDDALHDAGPAGRREGHSRYIYEVEGFRSRGINGIGCFNITALVFLVLVLLGLFAGYPVASHLTNHTYVNTTRALIDPDTPSSAYTKTGAAGTALQLVFSDEFNVENRTFYPGEDPFWEAVNLHYWQTGDLEWYDPIAAITTGGFLEITLTKETKNASHNLGYIGGMLQTWNKLCFTGGRVEAAVSLPGNPTVAGFWPAVWSLGNLGRAGYGASLEGTWPYAYDTCDLGTLPNQTSPDGGPSVVTTEGDPYNNNSLSYLPGQRLSRCTCPGESHPGPQYKNGTFKGRSASEIDFFEATASSTGGQLSQSYQLAPFDPHYLIDNTTTSQVEYFDTKYNTVRNSYAGGIYQEAASGLSDTNSKAYNSTTNFSVNGVEYTPTYLSGVGTGEIYFLNDGLAMWRLSDTALGPNNKSLIGQREVSGEPQSLVVNLGMSKSFSASMVISEMTFPGKMRIDYIRIYQPVGQINIGCDPSLYPTADYIAEHEEAYTNPLLTTWAEYLETTNSTSTGFPKNSMIDQC